MDSTQSIQSKNIDLFNINRVKNTKLLYPIMSLKKKNHLLKSLSFEQEELPDLPTRNKFNTYNINKFKNALGRNDLIKSKTRNLTMKNLIKYNSQNYIIEKTNFMNRNNKSPDNNNFLILTSLYKLPAIKKQIKLKKKPQSPLGPAIHSNFYSPNNSISITSKKTFNDSISSSYNESYNQYFNFRYNNEINKNNSDFNQSNQSNQSKLKKKVFSNLYASLKDKYYIDVEKKYNYKLDARLFPSDHSMKDKIIHMKKVSIFWNSVFKYCVPIINGQKYRLQHKIAEQNKLKDLDSKPNNSNYYDIFVKENSEKIKFNKSKSLSKIL